MSFNNPLGFNLTKSTPTTSTTNTNTTSNPSTATSAATVHETKSPPIPEVAASPKSPFLQNILYKTSSTAEASPPKFEAQSGVASAVVTIGDETTTKQVKAKTSSQKSDLIDLFEKFDVSPRNLPNNEESEKHDDSSIEGEKDDFQGEETGSPKELDMIEKGSSLFVTPKGPKTEETENAEEPKGEVGSEDWPHDYEPSKYIDIPSKNQLAKETLSNGSSFVNSPGLNEKEHESQAKDFSEITGENSYETSAVEELKTDTKRHGDVHEEDRIEDEEGTRINESAIQGEGSLESVADISQPQISHQVDSTEQYQQSHKPFDFQNFLSQLKKKSADPIVRYIRSFLVSFSRQGHTFSSDQRIKIIIEFKGFMSEKFTLYEPFASMDEIDLENSREGLEKLIMNRVYEHCFPPEALKIAASNQQLPREYLKDLEEDKSLAIQLEKHSWINGSHLDIDLDRISKSGKGDLSFIEYAVTELTKINNYRAPRDKIICVLNACKIIFSFLKVSNQETNADSFVPLLILILIKAKTDYLISNLHYIENFRGQEWLLHGETSYYLSTLQGAIGFIQNLSVNELTINKKEYSAHMEAWEAQENQRQKFQDIVQPQPQHLNHIALHDDGSSGFNSSQPQQSLSPSNVLLTSAELFTKSISNFLSPSPHESPREITTGPPPGPPPAHPPRPPPGPPPNQLQPEPEAQPTAEENERMKEVYASLKEIFPTLDTSILKDIIYINKGDTDVCIDACLQLVNDI